MFYVDVTNQIALVGTLCFSFFIFAYNLCLNRSNNSTNLLAFSFWASFSLSTAAFVLQREPMANALFFLSDIFVLLFALIFIRFQIKKKFMPMIRLLIIVLPFGMIYVFMHFNKLNGYLSSSQTKIAAVLLVSIPLLYLLRKEKGNKSYVLGAVLCLMCSDAAIILAPKNIGPYIYTGLKPLSYFIFTLFFHKEIYSELTRKIQEAEKKIAAVNKSLELEVKKRVFEIERSNQKLVNISKTDALTKAFNKAAILEFINDLIVAKSPKEFSILMFDIDSFKTINDNLGHITGDKCIKKVAVLSSRMLRDIDRLGRYGGDEFLIVLPETSLSHARMVAERLRKTIAETESPHFTVSIGIANYPDDGLTAKDLIAVADDGLYQSKRNGRNTISHNASSFQ